MEEGNQHVNWMEVFNEDDVKFLVLNLDDDRELILAIRDVPGWIIDFEDEHTVIFLRVEAA